jgi:RHS repeat-associated protein
VMGRITGANQLVPSNVAGPAYSVTATYDLAGNTTSLTYPSGRKVTFSVDNANRLSNAVFAGLGAATANNSYYQPNLYAPHGAIASATFGNGLLESVAYNYRLQPAIMELAPFTAPTNRLLYRAYNYIDANNKNNGNVINLSDWLNSGRTQSFTYDALNRVASAQSAATSGPDAWSQTYQIDAWGNLQQSGTKAFLVGGNLKNQVSDPAHPTWYAYDAGGNMTSYWNGSSIQNYAYDAANRITAASGFAYTYDVNGNRVRKQTDANNYTEYIYFGSDVLAEKQVTAGGAPVWTDYIFAGSKRVARVPVGATVSADWNATEFYHADHLGSATLMTNIGGTIVANSFTTYLPFGQEWNPVATTNHYKFTGKERDPESGLDYFGARYYGSNMGRWMSPDWAANATAVPYANFGDPESLNLYGYVGNRPINTADADGHCPICIGAILGAGAGAAVILYKTFDAYTSGKPVPTNREIARTLYAGAAIGASIAARVPLKPASPSDDRTPNNEKVPNPDGKKGGPEHQEGVRAVEKDVQDRGLEASREHKVDTPGGEKDSRFVDVVGKDKDGNVVEMHQVGKQNQDGTPVARERRAMDDIEKATGQRPQFHPYNKKKD